MCGYIFIKTLRIHKHLIMKMIITIIFVGNTGYENIGYLRDGNGIFLYCIYEFVKPYLTKQIEKSYKTT